VRIKLAVGGKEHVADMAELLTRVTIGEIRAIKRETGMTTTALQNRLLEMQGADDEGLTEENWDVYAALVYLILSRSGGHVSWADVDNIPLAELAAGLSVLPDEPTAPAQQPHDVPVAAGG